MRRVAYFFLGLAALALAACSTATPAQNGGAVNGVGVEVSAAWARPSAMAMDMGGGGMGNGAAYMVLRNTGSQPDKLVSAAGDVAGAIELHTMTDNNGVMEMRQVDGIDLPVGEQVELRPGGFHVMLIGLKSELKPGDRIPLTLTFQNAGTVDVVAEVREQ